MKLLFFSDVHGCCESLAKIKEHCDVLQPDMMVMLGDALYHGPRNPLRHDYQPPEAVKILNSFHDKIVAVRGNCDCEVDQMMLDFPIMADCSNLLAEMNGGAVRRFFLSHGHVWNEANPPKVCAGTVICSGHTHVPRLEFDAVNDFWWFNPGSISLPKGGRAASFGWYDGDTLSLRNLADGTPFKKLTL